MSRYTLNLTAGGNTYSFGLDDLNAVFSVLAESTEITSYQVIDQSVPNLLMWEWSK
jgi:hypothetical protein